MLDTEFSDRFSLSFPEFSLRFPEKIIFKSRVPNFLIFQVFTFPPSFGWNLPSAPQ